MHFYFRLNVSNKKHDVFNCLCVALDKIIYGLCVSISRGHFLVGSLKHILNQISKVRHAVVLDKHSNVVVPHPLMAARRKTNKYRSDWHVKISTQVSRYDLKMC